MNILILYDRESIGYGNMNLSSLVQTAIEETGNKTDMTLLNGDEIKPCLGCFHCWVKTPGLCSMTQDCANTIAGQVIRSDTIIYISKICYGSYSYDIKSFLDRSIPNTLPFFEIIQGEMHHKMRYKRFPRTISIGYGPVTERERQAFIALTERNSLNFRPPKHFVFTVQDTAEINQTLQSLKNVLTLEVTP